MDRCAANPRCVETLDELEASVLRFYAEVGQRLKKWQPAAPKMVPDDPPTEEREQAQAVVRPQILDLEEPR